MEATNGWMGTSLPVRTPPSPSPFKSHITLMEWENDGVRTQSKSDGKLRGLEDTLQDDKHFLSERGEVV